MKKCKHCQSEIDSNAKICPNCRKKQGMSKWLIIILVIVGVALVSSIIGGNSDSKDTPAGSTDSFEKISLLEGHTGRVESEYSYEITGTLQNNTDKDFSYVEVEFYTYDSEGNLLDTCLGNNSGLEANGKWKFTASCFFSNGDASNVNSYKLKEITQW